MTARFINKGHVYFGADEYPLRENNIIVQESTPGVIDVHLGFLKIHHRYSVTVEIPKPFFRGFKIQSILKAIENSFPNVNCKVISITDEKEFFVFEVDFAAEVERNMSEELLLNMDSKNTIKIHFIAMVLGLGKGTPLLRNGIKNVGVTRDDASDHEWQR